MKNQGNCGRGARDYTGAESVLAGRLAQDLETAVYPEDRCEKCLNEGVLDSETCFHRHWGANATRRRVTS